MSIVNRPVNDDQEQPPALEMLPTAPFCFQPFPSPLPKFDVVMNLRLDYPK